MSLPSSSRCRSLRAAMPGRPPHSIRRGAPWQRGRESGAASGPTVSRRASHADVGAAAVGRDAGARLALAVAGAVGAAGLRRLANSLAGAGARAVAPEVAGAAAGGGGGAV